ncbi:hypothetical protein CAP36_17585 [Chitinophagaceae bacterium IBVUCB2]|nr:hypothetical protein CAP36_17585 [Chitinophagaceae bacterium IBVUCB2]
MIGASIYGFVDYKQTSHNKEFTNMYVEEKVNEPTPEVATEKKEVAVVNEPVNNSKSVDVKKKALKKEEAVDYPTVEDISPIKPISEEDMITSGDNKKIEEAAVTVTPSKEHKLKVKRKKLSTKIFSRAPMKYEVEEVTITTAKADAKKEK